MDLVTDFNEDDLRGIDIDIVRPGVCELSAHTEIEGRFLQNAFEKMSAFENSGFCPHVYNYRQQERVLVMEWLGESDPINDEVALRRNFARLIAALRQYRIRHGDATLKNMIIKDNKPYLVDFQQAKWEHEPGPSKRPGPDADWIWQAAEECSPDTSRHIRKWRAIRPYMQEGSVLDLGCDEGDYMLFAQAENPMRIIHGVERRKVKQFTELLGAYQYNDIIHVEKFNYDTVLLFSVFPYMVADHGWDAVNDTMGAIVADAGQLFFETQLHGDGPGPVEFQSNEDVGTYLRNFAVRVERLVEIPVTGRNATRSIWRVKNA